MYQQEDKKSVLREITWKNTFKLNLQSRHSGSNAEKTATSWTAEETYRFCLIVVDTVNKAMLTSKRWTFKKAVTKNVFEAVLDELKITFMEERFKYLNYKVLKDKESINMDIKKTPKKVKKTQNNFGGN